MEQLRIAMEEEYIKNGLTKKAIQLSQKLDVLIAIEQRRKLNFGRAS